MRCLHLCLSRETADGPVDQDGKSHGEEMMEKPGTGQSSLTVSIGPHIRSAETTSFIIWSVTLALVPATIMGIYFFGLRALLNIGLCIGTSVLSEFLWQKAMKKRVTIADGSAFLTGLLLALNLPPVTPVYIPILGSFIAIVLAKQLFGGLGFNIFNPSLMGRAFLLVSFPKIMTTWNRAGTGFFGVDALTMATPLSIVKIEGMQKLLEQYSSKADLYLHLLIGNRAGCIGETAIIAIIAGAVFLLIRRIITWHIPLTYLGSAALLAWIFGGKSGLFTGDPLFHILSGGIVLGAFFMATDYVTSPATKGGQLIFGASCGIILMAIRLWGGYPEGCMFSILIMNCFAPLIDRAFRPKPFGGLKAAPS
jgi:Na+-translocating ferredoxin:NAD+ oxidoreductase subunit D